MFVPQSVQTQTELDLIANVTRQIISPGNSNPVIGCVQDSVLGSYLFTAPYTEVDWHDAMNIMMHTTNEDVKVEKRQYSGKDVFSKIIPDRINIKGNTDAGYVVIRNGQIKEGKMSKKTVGPKKNSIIQNVWNEYGMDDTQRFIDNVQRLVNNWLLFNGFTISLGDTRVPDDVIEQINTLVESKKLEVNHLITETENNPNLMDEKLFEDNISAELNAIGSTNNKLILDNMTDDNHFYVTITSGSKGNPTNLGQIGGFVGQQSFEGGRIPKKFNNRSLVHYPQNDDSAVARGFVEHSYLEGLTPQEFFFHTVAGRSGLIDTAIKTADTGYIQRKLIKALEDILIKYDGTVRNSNNTIIQFLYGDNNVNPTKQVEQKLDIINMDNKVLSDKFKFSKDELTKINKKFNMNYSKENEEFSKKIREFRDELRQIQRSALNDYKTIKEKYMLPVDFRRIIDNVKYESFTDEKDKGLNPKYIMENIDDIIHSRSTRIICMSKKDRTDKKSMKYSDEMYTKTLLKIALYEYLAPKRCLYEYRLNKAKFDNIINRIKKDFRKAIVQAGEMVGVVAAQSIGEPATQIMTIIRRLRVL